jgi:GxxExxY protein
VNENEVGQRLHGCALTVHKQIGPGLLESAYEACLAHELRKAGLEFERQVTMPLIYDGETIETGYRLDLLIAKMVVVEIKSVEALVDVHRAQLFSYLRLGGFRLGYLLNFNVSLMKNGIVRMANDL